VVEDAAAPLHSACPGGKSKFFTVSGQMKNPTSFDLRQLQQFAPLAHAMSGPTVGAVLSFADGKLQQLTRQVKGWVVSFTGADLWDLLNNAPVGGIRINPKVKNDILRKWWS
jgi:hypothetical protein